MGSFPLQKVAGWRCISRASCAAGTNPFWLLTFSRNGPFHCGAPLRASPDGSLVGERGPCPLAGRERGSSACSPCLSSRNPSPESSSELDRSCACAYMLCKEPILGLNFTPVTYFPETMNQVSLSLPLC